MSSKSSKTEAPVADGGSGTVTVGRIVRPHGVRGEVKVEVLSDVPDRFAPGRSLLLVRDGQRGGGGAAARTARTVVRSRLVQGGAVLALDGVDDRDGAEALRNCWLEVPQASVPEAPQGSYYQYELVGCRCRDGERDLGTVVEVVEDGGGLLLIVEGEGARVPIPFVRSFLRAVDIAGRTISLELPPGLIEACASRS